MPVARRTGKSIKIVMKKKNTLAKKVNKLIKFNKPPTSLKVAISPSRTIWMRYNDAVILTSTLGALATYSFNMNSIRDPDFTGVGHQPYAHDTWASLYNRYRVKEFKYRINMVGNTTPASYYSILPSNNTAPASLNLAAETDGAKTGLAILQQKTTVSGRIKLHKLIGVSESEYNADDRFQATQTNDPVEATLLHIQVGRPDTTTSGVLFNVSLWYKVELFDPVQLGQS